jgi:hypothetical protein
MKEAQLKFYKIIVIPIFMYRCGKIKMITGKQNLRDESPMSNSQALLYGAYVNW